MKKETKLKKCKVCGETFKPFNSMSMVCSGICAIAYARHKQAMKLAKEKAKIINMEKQVFRANDKRLQLNLTQKAFNKLRRLQEFEYFKARGVEPSCISCSRTNMDWCAGHFKTVGAFPEHRFNRDNVHLQCNRHCNQALSGNLTGTKTSHGYIKGLVMRYGEARAANIMAKLNERSTKRYTCDELIKMRKDFNLEIKRIEKRLK